MKFGCIFILLYVPYFTLADQVTKLKELWQKNTDIASKWTRPTASLEFRGFSNETVDHGNYDFVVIGAGSAGSVLASRLSEINNWKILLIEAGENEELFGKIPGAFHANILSNRNWGYLTTPQKYSCYGKINNRCDYSRGKVLGGTSSINAMLYVRGNPLDYDNWGSDEWSFKNVLPYFLKLENASTINVDTNFRGTSGLVSITNPDPQPDLADVVIKSALQLGDKYIDYNGPTQLGVALAQRTIKDGKRLSASSAYLNPIVKERNNLHILTKTLVTRLSINGTHVSGVHFLSNGKSGFVTVNKEVTVSAGSINSPQLLILSGIGPTSQLQKLNIPLSNDLPVGQHFQDHVSLYGLSIETNVTKTTESFDKSLRDFIKGYGALTYAGADEIRFISKGASMPDIQIFFEETRGSLPSWICKLLNCNETSSSMELAPTITLAANLILLHPKSRGQVTLKSNDPTEFPEINPNFLSHKDDILTLLDGIEEVLKILETEPFRKIAAKLVRPKIDKCIDTKSDVDFWYCVIRHQAAAGYHAISTCKMGSNSNTSVVNYNLFVHGFKNLRVADASVIPHPPSGHTNGIAMMIGEKAADLMKKAHL